MLISSIASSCNDAQAVHAGKVNQKTTQELRYGYNELSTVAQDVKDRQCLFTSDVDKDINCFDDFKKNYDYLNPPTFEEYCDEQLNGVKRNIDYKAEYSKYLEKRGCKTESELEALNTTDYYSTNQLREDMTISLWARFVNLSEKTQYSGDSIYDAQYIVKNTSIERLCKFHTDSSPLLSNEYETDIHRWGLFKDLISELPKDKTGKFNPDDIINASDKMIEILKEKNGNRNKAAYEIEQNQVFNRKDFTDDKNNNNIKNLTAYAFS